MPYLIVGNWKMYFTHAQAIAWIQEHAQNVRKLIDATQHTIVLCPSYDALEEIAHHVADLPITIGAQDCAPTERGAYTGQVSATSLKEIGCTHCIIGHSETRQYQGVTNDQVAQKLLQALHADLTAIVCIGENKKAFEADNVQQILSQQLEPVLNAYATQTKQPLIIAYEPVWSIGTDIIPEPDYLQDIYAFITTQCKKQDIKPLLLYGGSVNADNIHIFRTIPYINGFLIGRTSTDFTTLQKIVK